jgi:hypothetical protein
MGIKLPPLLAGNFPREPPADISDRPHQFPVPMMAKARANTLGDGFDEPLVGGIHAALRHDVHGQFLRRARALGVAQRRGVTLRGCRPLQTSIQAMPWNSKALGAI